MEINRKQRALDIVLLVLGLFFLTMGCTDIGADVFGVVLGFGMGLPMLGLYIWRKVSRKEGKFAPAGWVSIVACATALFFLVMGIAGLASGEGTQAIFGLVFGGALAAAYGLRRREELRKARETEGERKELAQKQNVTVKMAQPQQRQKPQAPAQTALTICPHCGAPAKEKICPYCGMEK